MVDARLNLLVKPLANPPTLRAAFDQSLRLSHLLPEWSSGLLLPLPGVKVPPGVEGLVVEEEEGAASKVAEERGKDTNQEEFGVGIEVRLWKESRVLVCH